MYSKNLENLLLFSAWFQRHVRQLMAESFPIPKDVICLSSPPSKIVQSYQSMSAYGALYRCQCDKSASGNVAFDSGMALVERKTVAESIDIGVLKQILVVDYGPLKPVVMRAEWMKHMDEGRRTMQKDSHGFWTMLLKSKEDVLVHNPYVFPKLVSQLLFMDDANNPDWKVVILHEPCSRQIIGEKEQAMFGNTSASIPNSGLNFGSNGHLANADIEDLIVPLVTMEAIDA